MTDNVHIAELDDEPGKVYVIGVPIPIQNNFMERAKKVLNDHFDHSGVLVLGGPVESVKVGQMDLSEFEKVVDYYYSQEEQPEEGPLPDFDDLFDDTEPGGGGGLGSTNPKDFSSTTIPDPGEYKWIGGSIVWEEEDDG